MNSKGLKSNKKQKVSVKTYVFWGSVFAAVLVLIILLVINAANNRTINNFDSMDYVKGNQVFTVDEDEYFVLFYDFAGEKRMEEFDNVVLKYLQYQRNNKLKATPVYGADLDEYSNKLFIYDSSNIEGTTTYPGNTFVDVTDSSVLRFKNDDIPLLILIKDGEVTNSYEGETAVKEYLSKLCK